MTMTGNKCLRPGCGGIVISEYDSELGYQAKCLSCGRSSETALVPLPEKQPKRRYVKRPGVVYGGNRRKNVTIAGTIDRKPVEVVQGEKTSVPNAMPDYLAELNLLRAEYEGYRQAVVDMRSEKNA